MQAVICTFLAIAVPGLMHKLLQGHSQAGALLESTTLTSALRELLTSALLCSLWSGVRVAPLACQDVVCLHWVPRVLWVLPRRGTCNSVLHAEGVNKAPALLRCNFAAAFPVAAGD